jgi:pimeloyl-ACP methyl ester carboxylesterase
MDWWTGGFTDREPFTAKLTSDPSATPWELVREQQYAFWQRTCNGRPAIVLGASLGGAPAMDFAVAHPEAVAGLVLMDSGGHSYAQPPPFFTAALAGPVSNFFAWRGEENLLPFPHLWRKEAGWREALEAYLASGGYQRRVEPGLIKTVPQRTLVLWGEEDDVLPVEDAQKFAETLPACDRVVMIPDAMHAPALENPDFVAKTVAEYVTEFNGAPASAPAGV